MADVTELRCWPSCVRALDWSQDNIIALASDERVELLFPNTVSYERDNDVPQWQHVPLQVPWFSNDELPVKDPAPWSNFSIGEEISPSVPIAIAWSPAGLAKHRRSALGVLTSNLVLSIWSAEGKLQEESSWNRRLLINNAIADYFTKIETSLTSHVSSNTEELLRLRTRIRSFTWAPALPSTANTMGTQTSYGRQYMATTNEDNQLLFLSVDSPTSTLGSSQIWSATVLTHMAFKPGVESIFTDPLFFDELLKQQRFISHVAWSPWVSRGDVFQSVLAYATNEEVRGRVVICKDLAIELGAEVTYPGISLRYSGSMSWCPVPKNNDEAILALFTDSGLVYLTIAVQNASIVEEAEHDLDGRWDQVSGIAWDYENNHTSPRLHFSSLLSTVQSPTAVVRASSGSLETGKVPNWKEKIENSMVLFSVKNDLKGHSKTKVWGLTASPTGDFIAACNSLHPSDSIEYGPPADRRGTVALSTLRQYNKIRESFPIRNTTAEGVLFTLKKLVENTVEDAEQMPAFAEEAVDKLLLAYKPIEVASSDDLGIELDNIEELTRRFKSWAMFNENTLRDRYSILVTYACNETTSNELAKTLISYRLATVLQKLPEALSCTAFSKEVRLHHKQLVTMINGLFSLNDTQTEALERAETEQSAAGTGAHAAKNNLTLMSTTSSSTVSSSSDSRLGLAELTAVTDQCDFCSSPIPFTDLTTATCTSGHEFPRCGISFIAIQAPGVTKFCGICSTPFLSDEFIRAQEAGEIASEESRVTLARVLSQACDVCVFCGGKFVG